MSTPNLGKSFGDLSADAAKPYNPEPYHPKT